MAAKRVRKEKCAQERRAKMIERGIRVKMPRLLMKEKCADDSNAGMCRKSQTCRDEKSRRMPARPSCRSRSRFSRTRRDGRKNTSLPCMRMLMIRTSSTALVPTSSTCHPLLTAPPSLDPSLPDRPSSRCALCFLFRSCGPWQSASAGLTGGRVPCACLCLRTETLALAGGIRAIFAVPILKFTCASARSN